MLNACNEFVTAIDRWLKAWLAQDYERAKVLAEELPYAGSLLAIRPEFTASMKKRSSALPPEALKIFSAFLQSLSECCAPPSPNDRDQPWKISGG